MKAKLIVVLALILAVLSMASCVKFTCDICGKETFGIKHKVVEQITGEKIGYCCDDCYKELKEFKGLFN